MRQVLFTLIAILALSAASRDRLYIKDFNIDKGQTIQVPVILDNDTAYCSFQTDLYLPKGLQVQIEDGEYKIDLTERKSPSHVVSSHQQDDGAIRIIVTSQSMEPLDGTTGAVLHITVTATSQISFGTLKLRGSLAVEANGARHELDDCDAKVRSAIGDVTGDSQVDISDVNSIINMMLGKTTQTEAGDVNGDGHVDISDVNLVINIMLGKYTPQQEPIFETLEDLEQAINECAYTMTHQYLSTQGMNGEGTIMMWYGNYPGADFYVNLPGWALFINQNNHETPSSQYTYYPWRYYYRLISNANRILAHIDEPTCSESEKQFIQAQALTFRAYAFSMLAQIYCKRWVDSDNGASSGLILKLGEEGEGLIISSLTDTYAQIYQDLDKAIELYQQSGLSRESEDFFLPDIHVAYATYARAALTRNDWASAAKYAKLAYANHPLMSSEHLLSDGFCTKNDEWIWGGASVQLYYYSYHAYIAYNSNSGNVRNYPKCISKELFQQIPATDVRKQWWLDPTGYTYNTSTGQAPTNSQLYSDTHAAKPDLQRNASVYAYMQWKVRCNETPGIGDLCIFRSSEMYLIEAEAEYKLGNDAAAQAALVTLNKTSGRDPQYNCNKTGEDLFNEIKLYRRIELWGEGFDWFDLKRWNDPLVRHNPNEGGNFLASLAVTIMPNDKNDWTFLIPTLDTDFDDNLDPL